MKKVLAGWIKVVLIILGIGLVAGAVILLVDNEASIEETPNQSTEILANIY